MADKYKVGRSIEWLISSAEDWLLIIHTADDPSLDLETR